MSDIKQKIIENFGNKLRVRVCGICIKDDKVLLVNHHALNDVGDFWSPPGGGMDFGSSAEQNLKREFAEEVGIEIEVNNFLFVHEYLKPPLHAIELFFEVERTGGEVSAGYDPEMKDSEQIIKEVRFMEFKEIQQLDVHCVHQVLRDKKKMSDLVNTSGYRIWNP